MKCPACEIDSEQWFIPKKQPENICCIDTGIKQEFKICPQCGFHVMILKIKGDRSMASINRNFFNAAILLKN